MQRQRTNLFFSPEITSVCTEYTETPTTKTNDTVHANGTERRRRRRRRRREDQEEEEEDPEEEEVDEEEEEEVQEKEQKQE